MEAAAYPQLWEAVILGIDEICLQFDKSWRRRIRIIDTKLIVAFVFQLVLNRGTDGYAATLFELWSGLKGRGEKPRKDSQVSASSMCEARQKLDENFFKVVIQRVTDEYEKFIPLSSQTWRDRRIFAVDGSKINLPPELFSLGFNVLCKDSSTPQGLASCLYNLKTKLPCDFSLVEHGDERLAAKEHLTCLSKGDCVVYDRGYFGYALLYEHAEKGVDAVFRLAEGGSFPEIMEFMNDPTAPLERIVTLMPTKYSRKDIRKKSKDIKFRPIELRLIRYQIGDSYYFLGTTLDSSEFSKDLFPDLYHSRWGIEEFYKIAKGHLKVENFHSKTTRGVKQELYASFVLTALTRLATLAAESKIESGDGASKSSPKKTKSSLTRRILLKNQALYGSTSSMP